MKEKLVIEWKEIKDTPYQVTVGATTNYISFTYIFVHKATCVYGELVLDDTKSYIDPWDKESIREHKSYLFILKPLQDLLNDELNMFEPLPHANLIINLKTTSLQMAKRKARDVVIKLQRCLVE